MNRENINNYVTVLYFKSKSNFRSGYSSRFIAKLMGVDNNIANDVLYYLSEKGLIDGKKGYGDNVVLSTDGIDYVEGIRKGKIFARIKFKNAKYIPPISRAAYGFYYEYDIVKDDGSIESKSIAVFVSTALKIVWQLPFENNLQDVEKILLQFAKNNIIEKLKEGTLNNQEEVILMTETQPKVCPYSPAKIIETKFAEFEVELPSKLLLQEINENKLAALIIEKRDLINIVFSSKYKEKLLFLNQERNLLDFFKSVNTEEDFSHRLSSLGEVSRNMNIPILRKIANETDTQFGSVTLLEKFLSSINRSNLVVIDTLRQIGRIRNGYPAHVDTPDIIKSYKYFGISYPVIDYELAWTTLLNHYLEALKQLYESLANM